MGRGAMLQGQQNTAEMEREARQRQLILAMQLGGRQQSQANADRAFGETQRHNKATEGKTTSQEWMRGRIAELTAQGVPLAKAALQARQESGENPTERNIDPLSPEGIKAKVQEAQAMAGVPVREAPGVADNRALEQTSKLEKMREDFATRAVEAANGDPVAAVKMVESSPGDMALARHLQISENYYNAAARKRKRTMMSPLEKLMAGAGQIQPPQP